MPATASNTKKSIPTNIKPFTFHGVDFTEIRESKKGPQHVATCPFCHKENHFFVAEETGLWICQRRGTALCTQGNQYSFLDALHRYHLSTTTDDDYSTLSEMRKGIPNEFFQVAEVAYDREKGHWLIPVKNAEGAMVNLHRWPGPGSAPYGTPNCELHLFLEGSLPGNDPESREDQSTFGSLIFLCEGFWDALALRWLLKAAHDAKVPAFQKFISQYPSIRVVGVPGCGVFKEHWLPLFFANHHVVLLYDNDAGGKSGIEKAQKMLLNGSPTCAIRSLQRIAWPIKTPEKFDINEFVSTCLTTSSSKTAVTGAWKEFQTLISQHKPVIPNQPSTASSASSDTSSEPSTTGTTPASSDTAIFSFSRSHLTDPNRKIEKVSYEKLLKEWKAQYCLDKNMQDALQVLFATAVSITLPGEPLWMFLVGPPGSGKTAMLLGLSAAQGIQYESSLTPHNLISGWKNPDGTDSSLLPLWNRKCVVLKDYTEIIAMPRIVQEEIYGTLRGAYDGRAEKRFGNGIHRIYDDIHFSLIAGVTDVIHGDERATLGERFLKFEFLRSRNFKSEDQIRSAIRGSDREFARDMRLRNLAHDYLHGILEQFCLPEKLKEPTPQNIARRSSWWAKLVPAIPKWFEDRVLALAQLIAYLRAGVNRGRDGELAYRARPEIATRLAKQMVKLGRSLALIHGEKTITQDHYRIVERCAFDTAIAWNLEMMVYLIEKYPTPVLVQDLMTDCQIPRNTVQRRLDNLQELRAVERERIPQRILKEKGQALSVGQPPYGYRATKTIVDLWNEAKVGQRLF